MFEVVMPHSEIIHSGDTFQWIIWRNWFIQYSGLVLEFSSL